MRCWEVRVYVVFESPKVTVNDISNGMNSGS